MKEGIRYIEDILKEVSQEEGISYKELKELWNLHIERIKVLMEQEGVHIIHLPKIASLYFSCAYNKVQNKKLKKDKFNHQKEEELLEIIKNEKLKTKTKYEFPQEKKLGFHTYLFHIRRFFGFYKKYTPKEKAIKQVEKYSLGQLEDKDLHGKKFEQKHD